MTINPVKSVAEAKAALVDAEEQLRGAREAYLHSLEADDTITQVAFLLYQLDIQAESDWEGPVTWEHWRRLQIDSERDDWRKLAAEILHIIQG